MSQKEDWAFKGLQSTARVILLLKEKRY